MAKPNVAVLASEELFTSFFDETRRTRLAKLSHWTLCPTLTRNRATEAVLARADALITMWDSPHLSLDSMIDTPLVRLIVHCGGEVKKRFEPALFRKLIIANTAEPMATPTAELAAAFLLYEARHIDHYRRALRKRSNQIYKDVHLDRGDTGSLFGSEVGMIGFGRVGRKLVELLSGFRLRWRVHDPFAAKQVARDAVVEFDSLSNVLRRSSFLVIAAASTEKTKHLLSKERLATLPDGAVVINIARGSLVDLAALTEEVRSGRLRCALDVTDPAEPLPIDHPLRAMPGAIVTPHIGGGGRRSRGAMADAAMDEVERFFSGLPVQHRVTNSMLSRMT